MQRLADFSIETENTVLLQFAGGGQQRVAVGQLEHYLPSDDLRRVYKALRLRKQFLSRHMPRLGALVLLAGGVMAFLVLGGGQAVANLLHRDPAAVPAPTPVTPVHMLVQPPKVWATPRPRAVTKRSVPQLSRRVPSHRKSSAKAHPKAKLTVPALNLLELPETILPAVDSLVDLGPAPQTSEVVPSSELNTTPQGD